MLYFCCDENRREAVRQHPTLNGLDFLEVMDSLSMPVADRQRTLLVRFLKDKNLATLKKENFRIVGGERITNVAVIDVQPDPSSALGLRLTVNQPGDFSTYTLRLAKSPTDPTPPADFDPLLSAGDFSFK